MLDPEIFLKAQIVLEFGYGIVIRSNKYCMKDGQISPGD